MTDRYLTTLLSDLTTCVDSDVLDSDGWQMALENLEDVYVDFYMNMNTYDRKKARENSGINSEDENELEIKEPRYGAPKKKKLCFRLHVDTTTASHHRQPTTSITVSERDLIDLDKQAAKVEF